MKSKRKGSGKVVMALVSLSFGSGIFVSTIFSAEVLIVVASAAMIIAGLVLLIK